MYSERTAETLLHLVKESILIFIFRKGFQSIGGAFDKYATSSRLFDLVHFPSKRLDLYRFLRNQRYSIE